jgi:hypothetical protein
MSSADVRFGSQPDIRTAKGYVRFTPDSDRESGRPVKVMSALPLKADMCCIRSLPARPGNKAPDLCPAFVVLVWPYDGEPKFVWCSYQRIGRHLDPLAVKSHSIFAVLRIPIHILDALAISERAAKPSPACKAVEPPLERRVFIFSIEVAGES